MKKYYDLPFADLAKDIAQRTATFFEGAAVSANRKSHAELEDLAYAYLERPTLGPENTALLLDGVQLFLDHSLNLRHGRYMGHQVPPPLPAAALMDLVTSALNQGLAVAEMSPMASAIERAVIRKLNALLGWPAHGGIATSGGTLANMTAILAARNRHFPNAWREGIGADAYLIVGEDSHYSISRAMGVLGLGTDRVVSVPVNEHHQLTAAAAAAAIERIGRERVFAVVASAPSTPIGAIDDLKGLGELCHALGIWYHVDAVHGGPLLFSERLAPRLAGIELADSVSWDAHKMMHVSSLCSFVLYREPASSTLAFENKASYLFDDDDLSKLWLDSGKRTFECTKRALCAPLWLLWGTYGEELFREIVESTTRLAEEAHRLFSDAADFECPFIPQSNILCFRYVGGATADHSAAQRSLRKRLLADGKFFITQTNIASQTYLRLTLINPLTTVKDIVALMDELRSIQLDGPAS